MRTIPPSELLVNDDGSVYHLHLRPEDLADTVILVGDPGRVAMVAAHFDTRDKEVSNREFHTITGIVYVKDNRTDTYQPFISENGKYCKYNKDLGKLTEL